MKSLAFRVSASQPRTQQPPGSQRGSPPMPAENHRPDPETRPTFVAHGVALSYHTIESNPCKMNKTQEKPRIYFDQPLSANFLW
jgi:hypothetical protein